MTALKTMYPAAVNSKATTTLGALDPDTTQITVLDAAVLPEAPNLLVLGSDNTAETVLMTNKDGNLLTVERGFQGIAKSWKAGTLVARNFTAYDHDAFAENLKKHNEDTDNPHNTTPEQIGAAAVERVEAVEELQNGIRNYTTFAEIDPTYNATTPILTVFNAMQSNSVLNTTINQANTIYPATSGSLTLIKLTSTTGSAQFLSSDGKLSTGAFSPTQTKANDFSGGGVLAGEATPTAAESGAGAVFSGWNEWEKEVDAIVAERNVKTFTTLEQIGIDDNDLSDTDYFSNVQAVAAAMPNYSRLFMVCNPTILHQNFAKALNMQLIADGLREIPEAAETVFEICRASTVRVGMPIQIWRNGSDIKIIGQYDVDGETAKLYPFREVAAVDKKFSTANETLILLNGFTAHNEGVRVAKNGNYVSVNFIIQDGGDRANGTVAFVLPVGYRPIGKSVSLPIIVYGGSAYESASGYLAVQINGEAKIYGLAGTTADIFCANGFSI